VDPVITETLPLTAFLSIANCHFNGTPLEPGLPEFATQDPQGTSSGRVDAPDVVFADEDDLTLAEDEPGKIFEEEDSTGVIPARLELLMNTGVIPGRLELETVNGLKLEDVVPKGLKREDELNDFTGT
jgi:hypothetical protein